MAEKRRRLDISDVLTMVLDSDDEADYDEDEPMMLGSDDDFEDFFNN